MKQRKVEEARSARLVAVEVGRRRPPWEKRNEEEGGGRRERFRVRGRREPTFKGKMRKGCVWLGRNKGGF